MTQLGTNITVEETDDMIRAADIESSDLYRTTADSFLFHPGRQLHPTLPRERRDQAAWPRDRPGDSADGGPVHAQQGTVLYMACGELAPRLQNDVQSAKKSLPPRGPSSVTVIFAASIRFSDRIGSALRTEVLAVAGTLTMVGRALPTTHGYLIYDSRGR